MLAYRQCFRLRTYDYFIDLIEDRLFSAHPK